MIGIKSLTREVFFALPAHVQIAAVSIVQQPGVPHFQEFVAPQGPEREAQWKRAKAAGVEGLRCAVFDKPDDLSDLLRDVAAEMWRRGFEEEARRDRRRKRR